MYSNKQDLIQQEILVSDLNCHIRQVKEDIRATFASHVSTLLSREQWLMDQVDSIKEEMLNQLVTKKLTSAKTKASLQSCAEFLKFAKNREDTVGVEYTKKMMLALNYKTQESCSENYIPSIAFVHDRSGLHQFLTRYGKLETESCEHSTDEESVLSDRSWDLLEEKKEDSHEMAEKESETSDVLSPKSVCCGVGFCGKPFSEIEDMDLSKYQPITEVFEEEKGFQKKSLKNICRANELCKSISECVCDVKCDQQNAIKRAASIDNPILQLQAKFQAVYSKNENSFADSSIEADFVELHNVAESDPVHRAHALMNKALKKNKEKNICSTANSDNSVTLLAKRLQCVLGGSSYYPDISVPLDIVQTPKNQSKDDVVCQLHSRLQSIVSQSTPNNANQGKSDDETLDGYQSFNDTTQKSSELDDSVSLWKGKSPGYQNLDKSKNGNTADLSEKLARIFTPKLPRIAAEFSQPCCQDPVEDLAMKLKRIIN